MQNKWTQHYKKKIESMLVSPFIPHSHTSTARDRGSRIPAVMQYLSQVTGSLLSALVLVLQCISVYIFIFVASKWHTLNFF